MYILVAKRITNFRSQTWNGIVSADCSTHIKPNRNGYCLSFHIMTIRCQIIHGDKVEQTGNSAVKHISCYWNEDVANPFQQQTRKHNDQWEYSKIYRNFT